MDVCLDRGQEPTAHPKPHIPDISSRQPQLEAGVNSSLTDRVLRVKPPPLSTLEAAGAGFQSELAALEQGFERTWGSPSLAWWGSLSDMVYITYPCA